MSPSTTDQIYIEYQFTITPLTPWNDVLSAQLGEVGFDSFIETDNGITAYILKSIDTDNILDQVDLIMSDVVDIAFAKAEIEPTNWNAEWEKNFKPISVDQRCEVRAPFHQSSGLEYEIVIEPKMSFGTGHHQTTHMMIQLLMQEPLSNKTVLDMGSGTGVLAILAHLRGASTIDAIDIDTWCYDNALENVQRNNAHNINVILGGAEQIINKKYQVIIANINRNILLQDLPQYATSLAAGGTILFSGFYTQDLESITQLANTCGLEYDLHITRDDWVGLKMTKNTND